MIEVVKNRRWVAVRDYHEVKLSLAGQRKQRIVLCHYPMRVWNRMGQGAWMLHGHCHGSLIDIGGKTKDVGVDANEYAPIGIDHLIEFMEMRDITECEHHKRSGASGTVDSRG